MTCLGCDVPIVARCPMRTPNLAASARLARARAAVRGDAIGGQCDAWYLKIGGLITGGACRDLDGLQALDRAADNLVATANEVARRPDGPSIFPDPKRIQFNADLTAFHAFSERLHASGYDYWTADSGTIFWGPRNDEINLITAFDRYQTGFTAWRDYFRSITGQQPIGPNLPEPEANKGKGDDIFGKATTLLLVGGAVFAVVALIRR